MITKSQKIWLEHLSDTDIIHIVPYNPETRRVFKIIKNDLVKILGNVQISHRGSTSLCISGQGEIDLYIPIAKYRFNDFIEKLISGLGEPGSHYPLKRARFVKFIDGIKVEIFLINKNDLDWKNCIKFEKFLKKNPKSIKKYENLKKKCDGLSVRKYYTAKTIFINKILFSCKK